MDARQTVREDHPVDNSQVRNQTMETSDTTNTTVVSDNSVNRNEDYSQDTARTTNLNFATQDRSVHEHTRNNFV